MLQVTICGLSSSNPRTSYHAPVISSLVVLDVSTDSTVSANASDTALWSLRTDGTQVLRVSGDYFSASSPRLPLALIATGVSEGGVVVQTAARDCVVAADHITVECYVPVGVGTGYLWTLLVAQQRSKTLSMHTSYAPPSVSAITISDSPLLSGAVGAASSPSTPSPSSTTTDSTTLTLPLLRTGTAGGAEVVVHGNNFGADTSMLTLTWNGQVVRRVQVLVPHRSLKFESPSGPGGHVAITLSVGGQLAAVDDTPLAAVQYLPPTVINVALAADNEEFDCSSGGQMSSGLATATLVVYGSNLGDGADTIAYMDGEPCIMLTSPLPHSEVYFLTPYCRGTVTLRVGGVSSSELQYKYTDLVSLPVVTLWEPTIGPTVGGTVVTFSGSMFQYRGVVEFVAGSVVVGQCVWKDVPDMLYNATQIRYAFACPCHSQKRFRLRQTVHFDSYNIVVATPQLLNWHPSLNLLTHMHPQAHTHAHFRSRTRLRTHWCAPTCGNVRSLWLLLLLSTFPDAKHRQVKALDSSSASQ